LNVRRPLPFLLPYYRIKVPPADAGAVERCLQLNIAPVAAKPLVEQAS
jgi:hypothetical protein